MTPPLIGRLLATKGDITMSKGTGEKKHGILGQIGPPMIVALLVGAQARGGLPISLTASLRLPHANQFAWRRQLSILPSHRNILGRGPRLEWRG
jgi:hypothetical protein